MKYVEGSEAVLLASGRRVRVMESTDASYVKVEVLDTGAKLSVDASKFRVTRLVAEGEDFLSTSPVEEGPDGKLYRMRVAWESGELTEVADEQVTSASPRAKALKQKGNVLCLTQENVRWVHARLGELIARWDAREKAAE